MNPKSAEEFYGPALTKAIQELQALDPWLVTLKSGAEYKELSATTGQIELKFFGEDHLIHFPQCTVHEADTGQEVKMDQETLIITRVLLLHYLINADGTRLADKWVSLRQLPGGLSYEPVLRTRANQPLEQAFESNLDGFVAAAEAMGGEKLSFGDASFMFHVLPRLRLAVILYLGDEEFPSSVNMLFDATADHYLSVYDLTIVAGILVERLTGKRGSWRDFPQ